MSKQFTKVLALGLAAMMVLSGCGGTSTETKTPEESTAEKAEQQQEQTQEQQAGEETKHELKEVVIPVISTEEIETFNFLHSQRTEDSRVLVNLWDGLLTSNSRGEIVAGIADEWGTEDGGLTWKFHLRDGGQVGGRQRQRKSGLHSRRLCHRLGMGPQLPQERVDQHLSGDGNDQGRRGIL